MKVNPAVTILVFAASRDGHPAIRTSTDAFSLEIP